MTATPEERAEGLVDQLYDELEYVSSGQAKWMTDLIAQAIREAEDAAIERAARAAEKAHLGMPCFVDQVDCGQFNSGVRHAAKAIRSLKSKD